MKLSIITLTYNHLKYTKKFIESLYKYTNDFELIIVDNGSTDGTVEYLKKLETELGIKLILNKENLGFSKGNNQGIEIAQGEYIGFLNNDILLYPNWFEECEKVFEKEKCAFAGPRHINPHFDSTNEKDYIKFFKRIFSYKSSYEKNFDECVFSCVVTKRTVLDEIGLFDEIYSPAFFEDNDIKYRAILAGYGVYVVNTVCFYHFGSITSASLDQRLEKNRNCYYSKYPFAEYLSVSGRDRDIYKRIAEDMRRFPFNFMYKCFIILRKIRNRIYKILRAKK